MMPAIRQGTVNDREWRFATEQAKQFVSPLSEGSSRNHQKFTFLSPCYVLFRRLAPHLHQPGQCRRFSGLWNCSKWPLGNGLLAYLDIEKLLYACALIGLALLSSGCFGPYCYLFKEYVIVTASSMFVCIWHGALWARNIFWRLSSSASRPSPFLAIDRCKMIQSRYVKIPSPNPSHGVSCANLSWVRFWQQDTSSSLQLLLFARCCPACSLTSFGILGFDVWCSSTDSQSHCPSFCHPMAPNS